VTKSEAEVSASGFDWIVHEQRSDSCSIASSGMRKISTIDSSGRRGGVTKSEAEVSASGFDWIVHEQRSDSCSIASSGMRKTGEASR